MTAHLGPRLQVQTQPLPRYGAGVLILLRRTLEVQAKLRLELAVLCGLCTRSGDQAEVVVVDAEFRICRFRMIENIAEVHPEFDTLGFAHDDLLLQICIEPPPSGRLHCPLSESAALSGKWISQKNLTSVGIENGVQCTKRVQVLSRRD